MTREKATVRFEKTSMRTKSTKRLSDKRFETRLRSDRFVSGTKTVTLMIQLRLQHQQRQPLSQSLARRQGARGGGMADGQRDGRRQGNGQITNRYKLSCRGVCADRAQCLLPPPFFLPPSVVPGSSLRKREKRPEGKTYQT